MTSWSGRRVCTRIRPPSARPPTSRLASTRSASASSAARYRGASSSWSMSTKPTRPAESATDAARPRCRAAREPRGRSDDRSRCPAPSPPPPVLAAAPRAPPRPWSRPDAAPTARSIRTRGRSTDAAGHTGRRPELEGVGRGGPPLHTGRTRRSAPHVRQASSRARPVRLSTHTTRRPDVRSPGGVDEGRREQPGPTDVLDATVDHGQLAPSPARSAARFGRTGRASASASSDGTR